jgi:NAD(P)-dependent dehydrogenase (short-subunit alcohol dehydrogenase family)
MNNSENIISLNERKEKILKKGGHMLLSNRVAIVTGGAQGIGRGIAMKFAGEGCTVAISDINVKEAQNTISEIIKMKSEGIAIECDATNSKQVSEMVRQVNSKFGSIDILVNNVGGLPSTAPVDEMAEEEWDNVVDLNLKSTFLGCKYVVPHMKAKKFGKIVNISSLGATVPPSSNVHYHSGKAGVLGMTTDLAIGLAPYNIYVNAIIPGPIRTAFFGSRLNDDAFFIELGKTVPLGRVGTPDDVAGAALFLASDLSSFVTGEFINVTGGIPLGPVRSRPSMSDK